MRKLRFASTTLLVTALLATIAFADPVVTEASVDDYDGFSELWVWASLSDPRNATYNITFPNLSVNVPYQCQHKGSATPDAPVTAATTFVVKGRIKAHNRSTSGVTQLDEDQASISFAVNDNAQKSTPIFTTSATVAQTQAPYEALGITMMFPPGATVPETECNSSFLYMVSF